MRCCVVLYVGVWTCMVVGGGLYMEYVVVYIVVCGGIWYTVVMVLCGGILWYLVVCGKI